MNPLIDTLATLVGELASAVTNQALNTDPILRSRLVDLSGTRVEVQSTMPEVIWHLTIDKAQLQFVAGPADEPNAVIRGTPVELLSWFLPGAHSDRLQIDGDVTRLLELADILKDFQPDLTDGLSSLIGNEAAATVLGSVEMGLRGFRSLVEGVGQSIEDQAAGNFVKRDQLETLLKGIDELRLRVDRLAANVSRHEQQS